MTTLDTFAEFAAAQRLSDLAAADRDKLRLSFLDTVGASIAGTAIAEGRALRALADEGDAGRFDRLALRVAGTRLTEIDDIHLPSCTTPGSILFPTALTVAEAVKGAKLEDVLAAVAIGYEAMTRLGRAINGPEVLYQGVWPTYFAAPFAAAAVTGRVLGLDADEMANALAIALTMSNGRAGATSPGIPGRWLAVGEAARAGARAAYAAAAGFTGDRNILEGPWLSGAHKLPAAPDQLTHDLGKASALATLSFKPYPAAKQTIGALTGLAAILDRGIAPADVTEIEVAVPKYYVRMIDHGAAPGDRLSGLSSGPFSLAQMALQRERLYDLERGAADMTPELEAFMEKISISADDNLDRHYPDHWPARITVRAGGTEERETVVVAPGDPDQPFSREDVSEKFRRFAAPVVGAVDADAWIETALTEKPSSAAAPIAERYAAIFDAKS